MSDTAAPRLSRREAECIEALCRGMTNREIAEALGIALPTVEMHIKRARERVGARTREHAIAISIVEKLIDVPALAADIERLRRTG